MKCRVSGLGWRVSVVGVIVALMGGPGCAEAPPTETFEIMEASIADLQVAMEAGQVTSERLVELYLARIEAYDDQGPALNAMLSLNPNTLATARALDEERATEGPRGPLHGIPIVLKDNYDTFDMPTTNASIALAGLIPPDDGFQVRQLREAGVVILGKTNLHEFARGITTISSLGGQTLNPYDTRRNPGGSSGGTAAAVAASLAAVGMGSDTCGSIRIPSAHNSLVGLRVTQGLSSRDGIIPLSHTQDVGGPLARTVSDLTIVLDVTVGPDPADPATAVGSGRIPESYADSLNARGLAGARLGMLTLLLAQDPEDEEVASVMTSAVHVMEQGGAEIVDMEIPGLAELLDSYVVLSHEFKFDLDGYLARTPGTPVSSLAQILAEELHHPAVHPRLEQSNAVESLDTDVYREALGRRDRVRQAVVDVMDAQGLDALIYPTMRQKAAVIREEQGGDNCRLSAHSGLPAITVPGGFTPDGLPCGPRAARPTVQRTAIDRAGLRVRAVDAPPASTGEHAT